MIEEFDHAAQPLGRSLVSGACPATPTRPAGTGTRSRTGPNHRNAVELGVRITGTSVDGESTVSWCDLLTDVPVAGHPSYRPVNWSDPFTEDP